MEYPTYQKDWTVGNQMFHVRCNDFESFKAAVKNIESMIPSNKPFPDDEGDYATSPEQAVNAPVCKIHHTVMTRKPAGVSKNGRKYPAFWSCGQKNDDGTWCNYRPEES